jgi:diacylglycerol kinase (ATP)
LASILIKKILKIKIILNPYANRWGAQSKATAIKDAGEAVGVACDISVTSDAGEGKELAVKATTGNYDAIVAAGGDGTVHEVVNGLIVVSADGPTPPLGVIPIGTGNDFSDMAGLPRDLQQSMEVIADGRPRQVDAGQLDFDDETHYFCNNSALAMEPMVTLENTRIKRLSGNIRYVVALVKALAKLKAWEMRVVWDKGSVNGPTYLLSVCNSPRTGGIFPMAPEAEMDDGLFDLVTIPEVSKPAVLLLLARLFAGTHIKDRRVTHLRVSSLDIQSRPGTPIHADGEIIAESATQISYKVLPGKISLLSH